MTKRKKTKNETGEIDTATPLRSAISAHLAHLATAEVSAGSLGRIEMFARDAKQLMLRVDAPAAVLRSHHSAGTVPTITMPDGAVVPLPSDVGTNPGVFGAFAGPLASAPASETFGANVMRNLVTAISKSNQKPPSATDLVRAIADAKEAGLDADIVDSLKAKLREITGSPAAPAAEEAPQTKVAE